MRLWTFLIISCAFATVGCGSLNGIPSGTSEQTSVSRSNVSPNAHSLPVARRDVRDDAFSEEILYYFPGGSDEYPNGPLFVGPSGGLYGTAFGNSSDGVVYKWTSANGLQNLFQFPTSGADGLNPNGGLIRDSAGNLYGTTNSGGFFGTSYSNCYYGCGVVFELSPAGGGSYTFSILHEFKGYGFGSDGTEPQAGLAMDSSGSLYGTTFGGGTSENCGLGSEGGLGCGTVFKLTHAGSSWSFSTIYNFTGGGDGKFPMAGVTVGSSGSLYGTTSGGGSSNNGEVFRLDPMASGYLKTTLYKFQGGRSDGSYPASTLYVNSASAVYGSTVEGGTAGTLFKLTTNTTGSGYQEKWVYAFSGSSTSIFAGVNPSGVIPDSGGDLYGTTQYGGACCGTVFKTGPSTGTTTTIYSFESHAALDGAEPVGGLSISGSNFVGVTVLGGNNSECPGSGLKSGCGTIFQMTAGAESRKKPNRSSGSNLR
jgi:uncharacterized repeat protein (TIGR03803 family)